MYKVQNTMAAVLLFKNDNSKVTIEVSSYCDPDYEPFLNNIVWGAEGFSYSEAIKLEKLNEFGNVYYVSLRKDGELAGMAVVQEKQMTVGAEVLNGYYMTNLAVNATAKSSIYVALMVKHATSYFSGALDDKGILYAYVEIENTASKRIANKHGYSPVREFSSVMFLKLFCKDDQHVRKLYPAEAGAVLAKIKDQYQSQVLTDFASSLNVADYYVIERDGKVVAGVQQDKMQWSIKGYPGFVGFLLLKVLPLIPILNKVFTPSDLRFIKFGNIFVENGCEADLQALIKSLLRRNNSNLGMVQFDPLCPVMKSVIQKCKLGFAQLSGDVELSAFYKNLSKKTIRLIESSPVHVSIADK